MQPRNCTVQYLQPLPSWLTEHNVSKQNTRLSTRLTRCHCRKVDFRGKSLTINVTLWSFEAVKSNRWYVLPLNLRQLYYLRPTSEGTGPCFRYYRTTHPPWRTAKAFRTVDGKDTYSRKLMQFVPRAYVRIQSHRKRCRSLQGTSVNPHGTKWHRAAKTSALFIGMYIRLP